MEGFEREILKEGEKGEERKEEKINELISREALEDDFEIGEKPENLPL